MKFCIATKSDRTIVSEHPTFGAGKEAALQLYWSKKSDQDLFELTEEGVVKDLSPSLKAKVASFIEENDFEMGEIQTVNA